MSVIIGFSLLVNVLLVNCQDFSDLPGLPDLSKIDLEAIRSHISKIEEQENIVEPCNLCRLLVGSFEEVVQQTY